MKKILKVFILLFILFFGYNAYALDLGKTEELKFSSSYTTQAAGNSETIVFYDTYNTYYYNAETNSLTTIFKADTQISKVFVRGTTAYIYHGIRGDNSQIIIHEVNALTGKEISTTNIKRTLVLNGSFVVDLKGNYYFEDNNVIDIYNKQGEKINSVTASKEIGSLNAFSPNDEYLFVDYSYYHEGILKLENGELKSGEMFTKNYRMPEWKFASDGKTAVNQYGEVAVFDFTNFSKPYTLKAESLVPSRNYYKYPSFYETEDKLYIPNNAGYIIGVSKTDYKKKDKYLVKENCIVVAMKYTNNSLYVLSKVDNTYYATRLDLSKNKINPTNTVLNTHTTLSHTKSQIKSKYNAAKPKADYTNRYKDQPSKVAPYYEGSLKEDVVTDTLNQLNYYRYLAGLNSVTINTAKQARSQKCGLIQAINDTLTHTPTKPSDMDDDFYKEAYAGCYASYAEGDTYSGNVSYNTRIDKAPGSFIDDNNNALPGVGHRSSMLDPFAKQVSFGNVSPYVAMSIYYDDTNPNKDLFYAWPPAGYFPTENIYQKERTMWSIWLDKSIKVQSDSKITLTYNNKNYVIPASWTNYDNIDNVIAYYFPTNIRDEIVGATNRFVNGTTVHVNISNLSDGDINTYEVDYDVKFFTAEPVALESVDITIYKEGSNIGSVYSPNRTADITVGEVYELLTRTEPYNATIGKFTYKIADTTIATISSDNKITPLKGGTTSLTLTDPYTKKSFTYNLNVYEKPNKLYFKTTNVIIKKGERYTLPKIVIEPSTAIVESGSYTSSDPSVAYISNGQIVGVKEGTATITYKDIHHSDAPVATLNVTVTKEDKIPVTSLTFSNTSMALEEGKTSSINAIIAPTNATNKTITWSSSNTSVATVKDGKVTGIKKGEATITGKTNNGKTATCKVVVSDKVIPVTGLTVNKSSLSLKVGASETLKATITPTNATVQTPAWTSKNTSIATVKDGKVTGVKKGSTEIVASAGNISVVIKVTVTQDEVAVSKVSLNKTSATIEKGKQITLKATITPTDAANKNITWTTNNSKVATVKDGKVTAVGAGTTSIVAKSNNGKQATCKITVTIKTGWQTENNAKYYYNSKGDKVFGLQKIGNDKYYFDTTTGKMYTGEKIINGHWSYFDDKTGAMVKGFKTISSQNKTVYYNLKGQMLYGLQEINGKKYYFDTTTGKMYTGEKHINGHWSYFDEKTGAMVKGFKTISSQNKTVYYNSKGQMLYGLQEINGKKYYFDTTTGKMYIGEKIVDGHWSYFGDKGMVKSAFQYISNQNKTVYYNSKGQMVYGLQEINGKKYYFDTTTGKMYIGEKIINGHWSYFDDKTGAMVKGFKTISSQNKTVYYNSKGQMLYGLQKINGNTYYFDKVTGAMAKGKVKIDNKFYTFDNNGKMIN